MKKMISFTVAALFAVVSFSFAEEPAQNEEKPVLDPAPAVGIMTEKEISEALEALEGVEIQEALDAQEAQEVRETFGVHEVSNAQNRSEKLNARKAQKAEKARSNAEAPNNTAASRAKSRRATRQEIRSMDILDRPNRPGHFYGNTVRRLHGR